MGEAAQAAIKFVKYVAIQSHQLVEEGGVSWPGL
jgi:hypothetical protein